MQEFFHHLTHALTHTLEHTWYILPILLLIYLLIEVVEHKAMDKVRRVLASDGFGIVGAAALGLFPQCGFSVAAANLYAERLITAGTVAAVFVATSDEAFPILLASPERVKWFLPLLALKFVYAIAVGFLVNFIFRITKLDLAKQREIHAHGEHIHEGGEHHHCSHCDSKSGIISTALRRGLSIFAFLFVTSFILHLIIDLIGEDKLGTLMMADSIFQPFLTALIGLIPNCAASVVATELFVSGTLGFGSLAAALSAGAGVGMLVLFRVNRSHRQNFALLGLLYITSALLGVVIEILI
ncbi:MAG: arsenic efflux protein [Clostridia bacterium]|nr:arsenic efflux protein [Clostridia bacterium]